MGDDHAGDAKLLVQVDDELIDLGTGHRVQAGRRLVVKEDLGIQRQRAGKAGPLFHPAGKLRGHFVGVLAEADQFQLDLDHDADRMLGQIGMLAERERDVVRHAQGIEQRAALEQDADALAVVVQFPWGHVAEVPAGFANVPDQDIAANPGGCCRS